MSNILDVLLGEKGQIAIAGAMGGIVRWLTLREDWRSGLISVAVGSILAVYLGPLAAPAVKAILAPITASPEASSLTLSGLLVGLGGITISGLVLDWWQAKRKQGETGK